MNARARRIATAALAGVATISVATAVAATKDKTFSTGAISAGVPSSGTVTKSLKVKTKGKITDINATVGLDTNQNSDYTLLLRHPGGKLVHLSSGNGGSGNGYGSGGCASTVTFDDEAAKDIEDTEGVDTLLFGSYTSEQWFDVTESGGLDTLNGKKLNGKWSLIVLSTESTGAADLECFEIEAEYKPKKK